MTEERDEMKAYEQSPALAEETSRETIGSDSPSEFTFPKGNYEPAVHSEHTGHTPMKSCHKPLHFSSLPVNPIEHASCSSSGSSLQKVEDSGEGYELALKSHTTDENVQPVLHALEQVKLSLKQKLNISPQIESRLSIKAVAPSTHSGKIGEKVEIPVGYPALHRLPLNSSHETTSKARYLSSPSQFSSVNHSPEPVPGKFYPSLFMESRSISSTGSQLPSNSTIQSTHIDAAWSPMLEPAFNTLPSSSTSSFNFLNPHLSSVIPFSSNYTIPAYPFSPNLMPQLPSPEGFSTTFPSRETGMHPPTRFSLYNEQIRPNMHR